MTSLNQQLVARNVLRAGTTRGDAKLANLCKIVPPWSHDYPARPADLRANLKYLAGRVTSRVYPSRQPRAGTGFAAPSKPGLFA
jgi:hypothetical protein